MSDFVNDDNKMNFKKFFKPPKHWCSKQAGRKIIPTEMTFSPG